MEEGRLMQSMLLDFYGELLTEKQRECYDMHYNDDLSLSEIAEQCGISRQGVWDNIRRAESALQEYESKTGLVQRFTETEETLEKLSGIINEMAFTEDDRVRQLAGEARRMIDGLSIRGLRYGI